MKYIGIDVGSIYLKCVAINEKSEILDEFYKPHFGNPLKTLQDLLHSYNGSRGVIGFTGDDLSFLNENGNGILRVNLERAVINYVQHKFPETQNIIDIGGSSIKFIELSENGAFKSYTQNSLCAAGTGSFLDEQANRMGINYEMLKQWESCDNPPKIASRCAVFAKTDLIHRQQEGYTKDALWSGLCKGLSSCIVQTLFRGRKINGKVVLVGGVSQNHEVVKWLGEILKTEIVVPSKPHLCASIGTALIVRDSNSKEVEINSLKEEIYEITKRKTVVLNEGNGEKPLELRLSKNPSFDVMESYVTEDNNEVRISYLPPDVKEAKVFMGIDIGSTSTKALLMDENENVLVDIYRKTKGEPVEATKKIFKAIREISTNKGIEFHFSGVGTTGSGRKMVGKIIGADVILNEISAHAIGALKYDPEVETIFEIGGQDSKYIRLKDKNAVDSNMNYICAAGTGSFVEEVANKLGYKVSDVGDEVIGIIPPKTRDRCTVFMEQDVVKLLRDGWTPREALAGVIHSIVENYLHKVVGRRPISKRKISFMGATARNKGLVAAFENKLQREIVVSPYCHVMGAYGVSLAVKKTMEQNENKKSTFIGLDFTKRSVELKYDECSLCNNNCKITYACIEGLARHPSWGYMCGREPDENKMRVNEEFKPFRRREKIVKEFIYRKQKNKNSITIGVPLALQVHNYQVFLNEFLNNLGFDVKFSNKTQEEIKEHSLSLSGAEFCFPAKLVYGHFKSLIEDPEINFIFYPHMISEKQNSYTTDAHFCPIVQGMPKISQISLKQQKILTKNILTPCIDFRLSPEQNAGKIYEVLKKFFPLNEKEILNAFVSALNLQKEFEKKCVIEGEKIIEELQKNGKIGIVFIGRPYNLFDTKINIELPQKLSEYGFATIPMDFLSFKPELIGEVFNNMYWNYGQKILSAARQVRENENLFAVYLTNFNCGPDSFILSYVEEIMGDKPMLILELDEHGGDAGYITRIEAFIHVIRDTEKKKSQFKGGIGFKIDEEKEWQNRRLWIPPMHPICSRLFASAFRAYGFNACSLSGETAEDFEKGRRLIRGSECLPTASTIGVFIETIRKKGLDPAKEALFMPTAHGPCRFGQYKTTHLLALKKEGLSKVAILSPSSFNSYQGIPEKLRRFLWDVILTSDILFKMACKIRPYEEISKNTDHILEQEIKKIENVIEKKGSLKDALKESVRRFLSIPHNRKLQKPLVGIVGEIYVRCNPFSNENVVQSVEKYGGEVWLAPLSEWFLYTSMMAKMGVKEGTTINQYRSFFKALLSILKDRFFKKKEQEYYEIVKNILFDRMEPEIEKVVEKGMEYIPVEFKGEAIITVGRAILFIENGANLIINVSPFSCMPGTLTSAAFLDVQQKTGIPIVSMFYDGEGGQNKKLEVFLKNLNYQNPPSNECLK